MEWLTKEIFNEAIKELKELLRARVLQFRQFSEKEKPRIVPFEWSEQAWDYIRQEISRFISSDEELEAGVDALADWIERNNRDGFVLTSFDTDLILNTFRSEGRKVFDRHPEWHMTEKGRAEFNALRRGIQAKLKDDKPKADKQMQEKNSGANQKSIDELRTLIEQGKCPMMKDGRCSWIAKHPLRDVRAGVFCDICAIWNADGVDIA